MWRRDGWRSSGVHLGEGVNGLHLSPPATPCRRRRAGSRTAFKSGFKSRDCLHQAVAEDTLIVSILCNATQFFCHDTHGCAGPAASSGPETPRAALGNPEVALKSLSFSAAPHPSPRG